MLEMKPRLFLVGAREREQFRLAVQFAEKTSNWWEFRGRRRSWKSPGSSKGYFGASLPRNPFGPKSQRGVPSDS